MTAYLGEAPHSGLPVPRDHTVADKWSEGAGVVSSWHDVAEAVGDGNFGAFNWALAGATLDTIGAAMDPLGELAGAGVGWLIEHVSFLHEGLDALAGDPIRIEDEARTWEAVAARLQEVGSRHVSGLVAVADWQGAAADAYRESAYALAFALDRTAERADEAASVVLESGVTVATVRALVRDVIAGVVGDLIAAAITAGLAAVFTAGGSVAGFLAWTVAYAAKTAAAIADVIATLLKRLGGAARHLATLVGGLDDLARTLSKRTDGLARDALHGLPRAGRGVPGGPDLDAPDLDAPDLDAPDLDALRVDAPGTGGSGVDGPAVLRPVDGPVAARPAVDVAPSGTPGADGALPYYPVAAHHVAAGADDAAQGLARKSDEFAAAGARWEERAGELSAGEADLGAGRAAFAERFREEFPAPERGQPTPGRHPLLDYQVKHIVKGAEPTIEYQKNATSTGWQPASADEKAK